MEFAVLGWPDPGVRLDLDHDAFPYAGKFVIPRGVAVARESTQAEPVAAVSFDADRSDERVARLRYLSVRDDRRGQGIGSRLAAFLTARLHERGFAAVRIAVNDPVGFHALHKAGFGWEREETGLAELVLRHPAPSDRSDAYRDGMAAFRDRDLPPDRELFAANQCEGAPPDRIAVPN